MSFEARIASLSPDYWWRLDDVAGATAAVEQETGNDGIPQGSITFGVNDAPPDCSMASVASFANAFLSTPHNITSPSSAYSRVIFAKTTATSALGLSCFLGGEFGIPGGGFDYFLYQGSDDNLYTSVWNGSFYTVQGAPFNDGEWHLLGDTFDGTTLKLWRDGVLQGSVAATIASYGGFWRVGGAAANSGWPFLPSGSLNSFTGELAHAAIWNRGLSDPEMRELGGRFPNWIGEAGWLS